MANPSTPLHRIVTIAVAKLDPDTGRFELDTLGGEAFAGLFADQSRPPRLVSWNGNGFDLPVIRYRAMLHGAPMPALYRTDGEFKWNNYQSRYHDVHVDLMDVLSGYGASRWVGLGQMCELLGVPSKEFIEGLDFVFAGALRRLPDAGPARLDWTLRSGPRPHPRPALPRASFCPCNFAARVERVVPNAIC